MLAAYSPTSQLSLQNRNIPCTLTFSYDCRDDEWRTWVAIKLTAYPRSKVRSRPY